MDENKGIPENVFPSYKLSQATTVCSGKVSPPQNNKQIISQGKR
jgi:hypothetical protein